MTLEQFLALEEVKPALEFIDGRVTQKLPPVPPHALIQYVLAELFNRDCWPRRIAFAFPELRTTHSEASVVPDVSVYTWDRIPRGDGGDLGERALTPQDIAIEIISPGQS